MRAWIVCFAVWVCVPMSACIVTEVRLPRWDASSDRDDLGDAGPLEASIDAPTVDAPLSDASSDRDVLGDRIDARMDALTDRGPEAGRMLCGSNYVDTRNNSMHCGTCNRRCNDLVPALLDAGVSAMQCDEGTCVVVGCATPRVPNRARTTCLPCGSQHTAPCEGDAGPFCRVGGPVRLQPIEGWCEPCGGAGQFPCGVGPPCDARHVVPIGSMFPAFCVSCGRSAQEACDDGVPCDLGLRVCTRSALIHGWVGCVDLRSCAVGECPGTTGPSCDGGIKLLM